MVIISIRFPVSDWAILFSRETSLVQFGHHEAQKKRRTGFFWAIASSLIVSPLIALALNGTSLSPTEKAKQGPVMNAVIIMATKNDKVYLCMLAELLDFDHVGLHKHSSGLNKQILSQAD